MNIEKLNSLAYGIVKENEKLQYVVKFNSVLTTLQSIISQPQQPQFQTNLSNQLKDLRIALSSSLVNTLSPAWYQVIVDLNIDDIFGNKLLETIDSIFATNQITPANAKQELDVLYNKLNEKIKGFSNMVSGLEALEIGYDELEAGECEIGILIPREYLKNDLGNLGDEIKELTFIFNNYAELITGKKESFQIRNLSTSEPLITVATITAIAAGIAKTIGWIIDNYKKLLEIKRLRAELKEQGLSEESLKGISEHSNNFMEKAIEEIIKKLAKEYNGNGDKSRKNELLNGVRISLNKIANRIDKGFNFEIRIEPIEEDNKEDKSEIKELEIQEIQEASKLLQFMKLEGQPILSLPEKKAKK